MCLLWGIASSACSEADPTSVLPADSDKQATSSAGASTGGRDAAAGAMGSTAGSGGASLAQAGRGGGSGTGGAGGAATSLPGKPACKRGIASAGERLSASSLGATISWWYNWAPSAAPAIGPSFTPMIWGTKVEVTQAGNAVSADADYLLGFNEPNFFEQANLSASQAAAEWPKLEAIAAQKGLKLVSPAVNFCGDDAAKTGPCHDTNPVDYLRDFFAACSGCQVDYVAVHWYNCDGPSLTWYLGSFKTFGKPLWLTELACAYGGDTSPAGQEQYMREAVPLLEADDDVYRYAWFNGDPLPNARVLDAALALTPLGQVYAALPQRDCSSEP